MRLIVCATCGAAGGESRRGLIHLEAIPEGFTSEHAFEPEVADVHTRRTSEERDFRTAVQELIVHHATLHPASDCPFVDNVVKRDQVLRAR